MTLRAVSPAGVGWCLGLLASCAVPQAARAQVGTDPEVRFSVALDHMRDGRLDMALEIFKEIVKSDSENPYFRKGLGLAYTAKGDYKKAVQSFRKALKLNPYYADLRNDLGTALALWGKRDEAKTQFLAAFNDPTYPTPEISARNLGQASLVEKNYAEAAGWFRTALQRNPKYVDAHIGLFETVRARGSLREAVKLLEQAEEELPDSVLLRLTLGQVYHELGRFSEARVHLEWVAGKDPVGSAGRAALTLLEKFPKQE